MKPARISWEQKKIDRRKRKDRKRKNPSYHRIAKQLKHLKRNLANDSE